MTPNVNMQPHSSNYVWLQKHNRVNMRNASLCGRCTFLKNIHPFASASSAGSALVIATMEMISASPCLCLLSCLVYLWKKNTFLCGTTRKTDKQKCKVYRTVMQGVVASKRGAYNMQALCNAFCKNQSHHLLLLCKMHFQLKCVDVNAYRDSGGIVHAKNVTMPVGIISNEV